ncbi:MAG: TIGR04255 family protein [Acidobacteria bacterium]|nr:TIGR04255 family protein [Acidobacteriota bacterium]
MENVPVATEKLKSPAVVEAVCELRFAKGLSYTMVPGGMRERLLPKFSSFEVLPTSMLMGGIPDEGMIPPVPHHRFKSASPNALVQTGPRLLTVNVLSKYPTFEVFRELILFALDQYRKVADPGNPTRVGLRYINHIQASSNGSEFSDYLNCSFTYPKQLAHPPPRDCSPAAATLWATWDARLCYFIPFSCWSGGFGGTS